MELQVAGLVQPVGGLLWPGGPAGRADHAADAVRALLGMGVPLVLKTLGEGVPPRTSLPCPDAPADDDLLALRQATEEGRTAGFDAGVLEDWRTVLELLAARNSRLGAVD